MKTKLFKTKTETKATFWSEDKCWDQDDGFEVTSLHLLQVRSGVDQLRYILQCKWCVGLWRDTVGDVFVWWSTIWWNDRQWGICCQLICHSVHLMNAEHCWVITDAHSKLPDYLLSVCLHLLLNIIANLLCFGAVCSVTEVTFGL